ncbi:MAG TPA: hypothetical protein VGO62_03420, partial [Myxococcota bacterium]
MLLRSSSLASLVVVAGAMCAVCAALAGCGGRTEPGEGEAVAEGEGEGEGAAAGEGEGEGAAAGEGEGAAAGEGEGEGEGEGTADDVGDQSAPLAIAVAVGTDAVESVSYDNDSDVDCYQLTLTVQTVITASTSGACEGVDGHPDTIVEIDDAAAPNEQIDFNDDDFSATNVTHCSRVEDLLDPGSYDVCLSAFDGDVGAGITLTIHAALPVVLNDGDACDPFDVGSVCAATSACLSDGTNTVCGVATTLADNAACNPDDELHVCDDSASEACLSIASPTDFHCAVQTILADGASCLAGTTGAVCDPAGRLSCLDIDGQGTFQCKNAQALRCAAPVDMTGTTFTSAPGATDLADDSCNFSGGDDLVVRYVVTGARSRVTFSAQHVNGLEVRHACADFSTRVDCSDDGAEVVVPDASAGD